MWNKVCAVWFFFFICFSASAKLSVTTFVKEKDFILKNSVKTSDPKIHFVSTTTSLAEPNIQKLDSRLTTNVVPQDFYTQNFGFFCKQELRVEKVTRLPLRFRIGSLQQCNYYEGKK